MRRITLALLFPLLLLLAGATLAWAAPPVIQQVVVDRGLDLDAPGWPSYHQRVVVIVSDADGAGDIWCAEIIDPTGAADWAPACYSLFEGKGWWQVDDFTIALLWSQSALSEPTPSGSYTITVYGWDTGEEGEDTLTTAEAPAVSGTCPEVLSPLMDSVISDTTPTFEWAVADPGAFTRLEVEEEGTYGVIWSVDLDSTQTSADYDFDGTASQTALQPNHSCFWTVGSWYPHEDPDPRVSIWTANQVHGRFTVYGDWPVAPPELPGKLAYGVCLWGRTGAYPDPFTPQVIWGMDSIMGYNTDPALRTWLGPDYSGSPDWSPDGSNLLYAASGGIWIDPLDGTSPTQIPGIGGWDCRWAPDGNRIVYTQSGPPSSYTPFNDDVWIASTDGSDVYPLVDDIESQDRFPVWSPDGLWIAYRKIPDPDPAGQSLHLVRYDGTEDHALTATGVVGYPEHEVGYMGEHAWSPDGTKIVTLFEASSPEGDYIQGIGWISRDGGSVTPVFIDPPGAVCCAASHLPRWSPDGSKIVFTSGHHLPPAELPGYREFSTGPELWMRNADGTGEPVRLTYDNSMNVHTTWWAPNTEPGENVPVVSGDTTVTFETVTGSGSTTAVTFDDPPGPAPEGFQFLGDYYDISTDAEISGTITIAIHYDGSGMTEEQEQWLSLLHWEGGETGCWVDITVRPIDTANDIIRGECTSLSAFGVASGYQFVGLLPPVNNDGSSVFKLNRTVPVKFQLTEPGGAYVSTADARLYLARISNNVTGTYEEAASTSQADSGNSFRYDAESDQYLFNLGTRGLTTGTWGLQVVVNGMVAKQVLFSLR